MFEIASLIVVNLVIALIIGVIIGYLIGKRNFPKIKSIGNDKFDDLKDEKVFLYPYNFVSSEFDKSVRESFEKGEYSGHIEIELQNTSPLLIAEKQTIENEEVKLNVKKAWNIPSFYFVISYFSFIYHKLFK